jgi:hypothetical protein
MAVLTIAPGCEKRKIISCGFPRIWDESHEVHFNLCQAPETNAAAGRLSNVARGQIRSATQEKVMSEEKPVPASKKEEELSESEIADIVGGLNPQPLPPLLLPRL